jgi:hypothetical protein
MDALQHRNVARLQRCEGNAITGLILALLQRFATECNARAAEAFATCGFAASRLTIISAIACRIYGYNFNAVLFILSRCIGFSARSPAKSIHGFPTGTSSAEERTEDR